MTNESVQILQQGKTLLYPTDTVWGVGCDATDIDTVAKIFDIKKRSESKSLVILVDGIPMLGHYIKNIPDTVFDFLDTSDKPTTIIYNNPIGLAQNVIAKDNTVAIRIVKHEFCQN